LRKDATRSVGTGKVKKTADIFNDLDAKFYQGEVVTNEVTREKLSSDFKALVGDVEELLKSTSSQADESIADLRQRLGNKLEEGKKALSEQERALREKAEARKASVQAY
jgi:ElaB/YqjD/DUF883 family membrane-anchored ribosome-binding protein